MKLTYFNVRGRGEIIRVTLLAANQKFEDKRIEFKDWPELKKTIKYGSLPVFTEDNNKSMNESLAIARYLARKFKLYGSDDWEAYLVDRTVDTLFDLFLASVRAHFTSDPTEKANAQKKLSEETIPASLEKVSGYIEEAGGKFIIGQKPTLGDLYLLVILDNIPNEITDKYPKVITSRDETIKSFAALKSYLDSRAKTDI